MRLTPCGLTRMVVPAFFVGFAVAAVTGHDVVGWIVAAVVALAAWGWDRRRGTRASCTVGGIVVPEPVSSASGPSTASSSPGTRASTTADHGTEE